MDDYSEEEKLNKEYDNLGENYVNINREETNI